MIINGVNYSWTQNVCSSCWNERNPGRTAHVLVPESRQAETCCHCGTLNDSGIYVRVDPSTVPHPTAEQ